VHGRALAAGTGLKVARPDLTVVVAGGDGDGYSIGGNHFLHACRRNVDLTYIVMDNHVYGMTKGQASPTTEPDWDSKLSPGGTGVRAFHPLVIALASGANFVARAFSGDPNGTAEIDRAGDPPPGLLVRRDPEPLRDLPPRAARLEEPRAQGGGTRDRRPGARRAPDHDRRRLQPRRALRRQSPGVRPSARFQRHGGPDRGGVLPVNAPQTLEDLMT
jgi:hypothetical protein